MAVVMGQEHVQSQGPEYPCIVFKFFKIGVIDSGVVCFMICVPCVEFVERDVLFTIFAYTVILSPHGL